jgi:hypothetical protein
MFNSLFFHKTFRRCVLIIEIISAFFISNLKSEKKIVRVVSSLKNLAKSDLPTLFTPFTHLNKFEHWAKRNYFWWTPNFFSCISSNYKMTIGILIEVDGSACEVDYTLDDLDAVLGPVHNMAVVPKKDGFEVSFLMKLARTKSTTPTASVVSTKYEASKSVVEEPINTQISNYRRTK